ncbi:MAG: CoA-binding protein [Planctomycetota bacterium]|nr:CoA-binding protein [Planctomycetota bacterium]
MKKEGNGEKIAIIGASTDRAKYGNRALRGFDMAGYDVLPVNPNYDEIEGIKTYPDLESLPDKPDIISVYTPPKVTLKLVSQIAEVGAKEIYFNPGSADDEVKEKARESGLDVLYGCSSAPGRSSRKRPTNRANSP